MPDLDALLTEAEELLDLLEERDWGSGRRMVSRLLAALRSVQVPVTEEWEYGVLLPAIRTEPSFVGNEEGALYFMGRPSSSVDKYALDSDEKTLVRRRKAGPWEPLPSRGTTTEEE